MAYSAIRFEQPQIVHTASSSEINKLVIQYHVKDLKSYIRGGGNQRGRKTFISITASHRVNPV